jgi:hypothetical protein
LSWAAYRGNNTLVSALIRAGAEMELENDRKNTPFEEAISNSKMSTAAILHAHGAVIRKPNARYENIPALTYAAKAGARDMAQALIMAGANIEAENAERNTPFEEAMNNLQPSTMDLLINYGAIIRNPTFLFNLLEEASLQVDTWNIMQTFVAQQKHFRAKGTGVCLDDDKFAKAEKYEEKLRLLEESKIYNDKEVKSYKNIITTTILIPLVLIDIIYEYYYDPFSKLSFFKLSEGDKMLALEPLIPDSERKEVKSYKKMIANMTPIPTVPIDIIYGYHYEPYSNLSFFKPSQVDKMLGLGFSTPEQGIDRDAPHGKPALK